MVRQTHILYDESPLSPLGIPMVNLFLKIDTIFLIMEIDHEIETFLWLTQVNPWHESPAA
jgi:hypothetical protein